MCKTTGEFIVKALILSLFLVSFSSIASTGRTNKVVVSGVGEVKFKPDLAIISFGVKTRAKTALMAQNENSVIANRVLKMLRSKFKIKNNDIQTSSFNVSPHIQYLKNGKRRIDGYNVLNRFSLSYRKIESIGKLLDQLTQNGINDISSIQFSTDKYAKYEKVAMKKAMANAKEKAVILAQEANRKVGKVIRIIHGQAPDHRPMPEMAMAKSMMASTPVMSGEVSVSTNVFVSYELK